MAMISKKYRFIILLVFITSFALGIHNATLYNPSHGFDGVAHRYYIEYIFYHKTIPQANPNGPTPILKGENHQSPLYYLIGAS